jgi:hypothetical protein
MPVTIVEVITVAVTLCLHAYRQTHVLYASLFILSQYGI